MAQLFHRYIIFLGFCVFALQIHIVDQQLEGENQILRWHWMITSRPTLTLFDDCDSSFKPMRDTSCREEGIYFCDIKGFLWYTMITFQSHPQLLYQSIVRTPRNFRIERKEREKKRPFLLGKSPTYKIFFRSERIHCFRKVWNPSAPTRRF